ncbi:oogenesis-related [Myripristis murdjan]|uniref:Oogenesis-related gene n=1 Tax=Myripristis murdjan TaxID=586833 RepID=A0A667WUM9_9TELE|nr:uncharacterized protein LOC115358100 [Myripristis murdjan]
MTTEHSSHDVEQEHIENVENKVVKRDSESILYRLSHYWPFRLVVRAYRGVWLMLGFSPKTEKVEICTAVSPPARHSLAGRKRLHWVTRLLLSVMPRRLQRALGYPVSSTIGCSLSPEVRISPTKPCGKGSKRKQDEVDEEDEGEEQPSWVEALSQELADEGSDQDPDYEPTTVETDSDEYRSHNNTESDIEVVGKGVVIEDVKTDVEPIQTK